MDRLLQIILNRLMGRMINKGITHVARKGKAPSEMTAQERAQAQQTSQTVKRARQAASIVRRLMR